jgi:hypothetical protein
MAARAIFSRTHPTDGPAAFEAGDGTGENTFSLRDIVRKYHLLLPLWR